MTLEEITRYLDGAPARKVGVVGTLRADDSPHLVPVWFWYNGAAVFIWTGEDRAWVHQLRRDPRVAFSVQDQTEPAPSSPPRLTPTSRSGKSRN